MQKIKRLATNDHLIEQLVIHPDFKLYEDGTVYRLVHGIWRQTGLAKTFKNGKYYHHLKFKGQMLLVSRIMYRAFKGKLDSHLIVNHDDGNSLNNRPPNLDLFTQQLNCFHCKPGWAERTPDANS